MDTTPEPIEPKENAAASAPTEDPIELLKKERDEYLEGWRRAKADYDNLLKDTDRAKREYVKYASEQAMQELLPALDQFDVALSFTPKLETLSDDERKAFENWKRGLDAVRSLWMEAAKRLGLEAVPAKGPFNPEIHEAVGEEVSDAAPGTIVRVVTSGWMLNGKLIRPAKVIVSKVGG